MVYKRGKRGVWYYSFMICGVKYFGRIPEAQTSQDAKAVEAIKRREVFEGRYGKEVGTEDFAKFVDEVFMKDSKAHKSSWGHDKFRCEMLKEHFSGKKFKDITGRMVEDFINKRLNSITVRKRTRSATTVYKEFQVLSAVFSAAQIAGFTSTNPCREISKKVRQRMRAWNRRERYLTPEELPRLMAELTGRREHICPIVTLDLQTGMRRGAILALKWEHINFGSTTVFIQIGKKSYKIEPNSVLVVKNKRGNPYTIPMNQIARNLLLALREDATNTEYVFTSIVTGESITEIKRAFNSACSDAGIKNLTFHDLRHTFSTWAAECGVNEPTRRDLLGHSPNSVTGSYKHSTLEARQKAVDAVGRYFEEKLQQYYSKAA